MKTRVGINGFGRIGRQVFKAIEQHYGDELEVVGVNDLTNNEMLAYLLKYDSNYGRYPGEIKLEDGALMVDGRELKTFAQFDPSKIPWGDLGVDIVVESTGAFTDANKAKLHLTAGAKKVIISAPAKNEDVTIVLGVNDETYDPAKHHIISNASCTTNGLAPVAKVIHDKFRIKRALMTTVHSYTNDQRILDVAHPDDPRRARAAALNIIPTTTGAARAIARVIPDLKGKFDGVAIRVPTPTVSIIDLVADVENEVDPEALKEAFLEYERGRGEGILHYSEEPLVSMDLKADEHSTIVDGSMCMVLDKTMVKAFAWYDNEWGYSCRVADLARMIAKKSSP
ncbi:MAG: type I glyceraldehyde-3-phosphate dehydrogenase [Chloroflexi bacterium]|nr:type I glyceraldehyde-3-phosphate dehydrogenase [Chloroflexota bacterium]